MRNMYAYILIAGAVIFLIRVLPTTLIRKPIRSVFIKSFLYYVPYITLAVMTFPAIVEATRYRIAGIAALIIGGIFAWMRKGLLTVAIACCISALAVEALMQYVLKIPL